MQPAEDRYSIGDCYFINSAKSDGVFRVIFFTAEDSGLEDSQQALKIITGQLVKLIKLQTG